MSVDRREGQRYKSWRLTYSGLHEVDPARYVPMGDYILFERELGAEKVGSIYIPDSNRKMAEFGTVIAIGPDVVTNFPELQDLAIGDRALIHGHFRVEYRFAWQGRYFDVIWAEFVEAKLLIKEDSDAARDQAKRLRQVPRS